MPDVPRAEPHAVLLADAWQPPPSAHVVLVGAAARTWRVLDGRATHGHELRGGQLRASRV